MPKTEVVAYQVVECVNWGTRFQSSRVVRTYDTEAAARVRRRLEYAKKGLRPRDASGMFDVVCIEAYNGDGTDDVYEEDISS
jgi:hypothetical protein